MVPATLFSLLRLFKLKKRYRNVLDTMFELLPRMARYWPPPGLQVQAARGSCRGSGKREQRNLRKAGFRGLEGGLQRDRLWTLQVPLGSTGLAELSSGEGRELSTYQPVSAFTGKGSPVSLPSQVRGASLVKGHLSLASPTMSHAAPPPQTLFDGHSARARGMPPAVSAGGTRTRCSCPIPRLPP